MLDVINNETIVRRQVVPGVLFRQGEVAQLIVVGEQVMLTKSDGSAPLGLVISADRNTNGASNVAAVQCKRCCYATDVYDTSVSYPVDALLYVSVDGVLTTTRTKPTNPAVGMVEEPPLASNPKLKFIWF